MTHLALYREWRPKIFDEVVEQKHAVYALRQSVISGQIAHAYLFSGTRGTGKTTLAKIFARAINCLDPQNGNPCNQCAICRGMFDGSLMDIVEMDAASNNSVDNIRRICDEVVFMPAQAKYKVYIIDEVHMLSGGAFNALLKTLEEPPAHAVFILATTEPHRIPATILSRCQRYEFRRIPVDGITTRLAEIADADGIRISTEALQTIAALSDGAMRDAISFLDQARASFAGMIGRDDILSLAGVVQDEFMQQMAMALIQSDAAALLSLVDQLVMAGRDLARFVTDLAQHFRNVLICRVTENPQILVRAASASLAGMQELAARMSSEQLVDLIKGLSALLTDLRWASDARTALEIGLIRLMDLPERQDRPQARKPETAAPQVTAKPVTAPKPLPATIAATVLADTSTILAAEAARQTVKPETMVAAPRKADPETGSETVPFPESEDAPPDFEADNEPAPVAGAAQPPTAPAAEAVQSPTAPAAPLTLDADQFWGAILDYVMGEGHMTLYLFSRSAHACLNGSILELHFPAGERINYDETSQASAIKVLRSIAARLAGRDMEVRTILDGKGSKPDSAVPATVDAGKDDWISKIRKTADNLGIPVKMEE